MTSSFDRDTVYKALDRETIAELERVSDDYFGKLAMFQLPDELLTALQLGAKGVIVAAALGERGKWHYSFRLDGFDELLLTSIPYPAIAGLACRLEWKHHQCIIDGVSTVIWTNKGDVTVSRLLSKKDEDDVYGTLAEVLDGDPDEANEWLERLWTSEG